MLMNTERFNRHIDLSNYEVQQLLERKKLN